MIPPSRDEIFIGTIISDLLQLFGSEAAIMRELKASI
jgi:hypothetical protein